MSSRPESPRILPAVGRFWRERAQRSGFFIATLDLTAACWGFLRDSTPSRLRSRFGDAGYDWDYRVNTTSGAVGWRDRLLGVFHSPYQPTERELFHEMVGALAEQTKLNFADFTFIDLGSGKGRALLMASDYPFQGIVGMELLPALHEIARQNVEQYKSDSQKCFRIKTICGDATEFEFPDRPLLLYLFNPLPESGLRRTITNLAQSLERKPRAAYVLYHNPLLENVVMEDAKFQKIAGTHQFSVFASTSASRN
ncbi:MAG TPA: class I SAM-dependent methyltransferase [Candidatus Dormibacteraeota bacterium]|nr:class I SAM-dependent methyltransferase [Candidatus Dormibacteraeota bacterium]